MNHLDLGPILQPLLVAYFLDKSHVVHTVIGRVSGQILTVQVYICPTYITFVKQMGRMEAILHLVNSMSSCYMQIETPYCVHNCSA